MYSFLNVLFRDNINIVQIFRSCRPRPEEYGLLELLMQEEVDLV